MSCRRAVVSVLIFGTFILHASATAGRNDLLRLLRPDAPSLQQGLQRAGRKLQQTTFEDQEGPFTFDGFGFGYGGMNPGGGAFEGFGLNIYNIIFKDILNAGLNEYVSRALTNNAFNPLDFLDPVIAGPLRRDVVSLFGFDYFDKWLGQYLKRASATLGGLVDAGCAGPVYSLQVNGGSCEIMDDGSVECKRPSVVLKNTPFTCNLPYREAATLQGEVWQYTVPFGSARSGELGLPAGQYNFGAALNITNPWLGFNVQTRRLLNDFGVQQWYQYTNNLILNELLRIQGALVSGAVDSRILTAIAQRRADAANSTTRSMSDGMQAVQDATQNLVQRIAGRMNLTTQQLTAGLRAAGALPSPLLTRSKQVDSITAVHNSDAGAAVDGDQLLPEPAAVGASVSGEQPTPAGPTNTVTRTVSSETESNSASLQRQLDNSLARLDEAVADSTGMPSIAASLADEGSQQP